ncbi:MAG: hypothetical protein WDM92_03595 [Caulobacteraceae bacterium]
MQTTPITDGGAASAQARGVVVAVRGSVLDIRFEEGQTPRVDDAVEILGAVRGVAEVQAYLDERTVRAVAMQATDGVPRGAEARALGGPITVPVGDAVLGRLPGRARRRAGRRPAGVGGRAAPADPPGPAAARPPERRPHPSGDRHQGDRSARAPGQGRQGWPVRRGRASARPCWSPS